MLPVCTLPSPLPKGEGEANERPPDLVLKLRNRGLQWPLLQIDYAGLPLAELKNVGFIFRRGKSAARLIRVALACAESARHCRAAGHVSLVQLLRRCSGPEGCLET